MEARAPRAGVHARREPGAGGTTTEVIVDGISEEHELVFEGRHYGQAPEIDGVVYLSFDYGGTIPTPGDIVEVEIQDATEYDLVGVVVQTGGAELQQHAYLRHCLKAHPQRFRGIGLIPADCADAAGHMDRLAADGDIIGFRLFDLGGPYDPLAPLDIRHTATYPVWQRAAEKDYVLWLYPRAGDSHVVAFLIDAFPQVRVVFNHLMVFPGEDSVSGENPGPSRRTSWETWLER